MKKIFLEAADSYRAPATMNTWDDVVEAYAKALKFDKMYSVLKRVSPKVKLVQLLPEYKWLNTRAEDASKGCVTNGQTNADDMLKCLNERMETGPDVVYVTSANSAHNFSYALSKHAFEKADTKKCKVVVNFDNHRDFGSGAIKTPADAIGAKMIQCGGWGKFHVVCWRDNPNGAMYVTLANGTERSKGIHCIYSVKPGEEIQSKVYKGDDVFVELAKLTADTHEVYFTVDRDFMTGNGTKYEQGSNGEPCEYNTDSGMGFVTKVITGVKANGISVVGYDIIGLPTAGEAQGVEHETGPHTDGKRKGQMDKAIANVNAFVELAALPTMKPPALGKELPKEHPNLDMSYGERLPVQKPRGTLPVDDDPTKFLVGLRKWVKENLAKSPEGPAIRVFIFGKNTDKFRQTVASVLSESLTMAKNKTARLKVTYHIDAKDKPELVFYDY